jgi:hypothetical protein
MAMDAQGTLLILDQRAVIEVDTDASPVTHIRRELDDVLTPHSLLVASDGTLIIGDAREPDEPTPADLVAVDRTDPDDWTQRRLLVSLDRERNALVAPFAIVEKDPTHLLVLDVGLKPHVHDAASLTRTIAEQPAVHRVTLDADEPSVTALTEPGRMVYPTGMVRHEDTLYICDWAEPERNEVRRTWRARQNEFGVIVHLSEERRPSDDREMARVIGDITEVVARHRPAGSLATVVSPLGARTLG